MKLIVRYNKRPFSSLQDLKAALKEKGIRSDRRLESYMFAHTYLVMEHAQLQGNNPQALKQQYVAKRKASDHERRKESKRRSRKNSKKQCER